MRFTMIVQVLRRALSAFSFRGLCKHSSGARRRATVLVSQCGFPADECRAIYRDDARYGESLRNLERQPLGRFIFQG